MHAIPLMPVLPMTPENARDIGRSLKASADMLAEAGVTTLGRTMRRQSEWHLAYALTLATIQAGQHQKPDDPNPGSVSVR